MYGLPFIKTMTKHLISGPKRLAYLQTILYVWGKKITFGNMAQVRAALVPNYILTAVNNTAAVLQLAVLAANVTVM